MARICVISFRLGGTDGVAIEAAKWVDALAALGHEVATVAGAGNADVVLEGLAMHATTPPTRSELSAAIGDADVVVVENLASLPFNRAARDVLYDVLADRPALFRHHDLAWQRGPHGDGDTPRSAPQWRHVTINDLSRRELRERGVTATTMRNTFDCAPPSGDRRGTRRDIGVTDQPVALVAGRALARKNIPGALRLAGALGATLWILGPAEDGYEEHLDELLGDAGVDVRRGLPPGRSIHDAYAACDVVVMSSTWEGFGNPVIESVTHRRPLALNPYPVAREITAYGFTFFGLDDVDGLRRFLDGPDPRFLEDNLAIAREHFNLDHLPVQLATVLGLGAPTR